MTTVFRRYSLITIVVNFTTNQSSLARTLDRNIKHRSLEGGEIFANVPSSDVHHPRDNVIDY